MQGARSIDKPSGTGDTLGEAIERNKAGEHF